jgi:hypothetical protein
MATLVNPSYHHSSEFLSQEKSSDQKKIGIPGKAYSGQKSQGNYKGYRDVDGQEPLG